MKSYRTEESDARADEARHQRRHHGLDRVDDVSVYGPSPREALLRDLRDAWRPDHRPQTLREEVDAAERGARGQLAHVLKNAHAIDAEVRNRTDDALSHLSPREKLAVETREMWRSAS